MRLCNSSSWLWRLRGLNQILEYFLKVQCALFQENFYHFFYEFKTDNATLQYFNGRVCEQGFKYRVEKQLDFFSKIKYTSVIDEKGKEEYFLQKTNYSHFLDHQMYPILWSVFLKNKKFENYIFKFQLIIINQCFSIDCNPNRHWKSFCHLIINTTTI